jgi:hypothetical protein
VKLLYYVKVERSRRVAWDGPDSHSLHLRVNQAIDQMIEYDYDTWHHLSSTRVSEGDGPDVEVRLHVCLRSLLSRSCAHLHNTGLKQKTAVTNHRARPALRGFLLLRDTTGWGGRGVAQMRETIRRHYSSIDEFLKAAAAAQEELERWE